MSPPAPDGGHGGSSIAAPPPSASAATSAIATPPHSIIAMNVCTRAASRFSPSSNAPIASKTNIESATSAR